MNLLSKIISYLFNRKKKSEWEYGTCNGVIARRHKKKKNVQFILWKSGEQGHTEDFWINFHPSHWESFQ